MKEMDSMTKAQKYFHYNYRKFSKSRGRDAKSDTRGLKKVK